MSTIFSFDQSAIDQATAFSQKVDYQGAQKQLVEEVSEVIATHIGISKLASKGFMLRAAKQWQEDNRMEIGQLANHGPSERIGAVRQMMDNLRDILGAILHNPSQQEDLSEALKQSFTIYLKKYAGRE